MLAACLIGMALAPLPGRAEGTLRIQHPDGTIDTYRGVKLHRVGVQALDVRSPDGKGVLIVDQGACSYVGNILRCLLSTVTLDQFGSKRDLDLERGTIYANLTDGPLTLPFSSQIVPPNGVVLSLRTVRGTYFSLHGTIDEVTK
jgi:hypothetical protein